MSRNKREGMYAGKHYKHHRRIPHTHENMMVALKNR